MLVLGAGLLITLLNGLDDDSSPLDDAPGIVDTTPDTGPADTPDTSSADVPVTGPTGSTQVRWTLAGVLYVADVETEGGEGVADVTYADPASGETITVRQDLQFVGTPGDYALRGRNPREALTGAQVNYAPDIFGLTQDGTGWVIDEVCDANACVPAESSGS